MAFVVTEPCIKCKHTNCVDVCPVACFKEGVNMLVIDPDECIDCGLCVPECPVDAIFQDDEVPEKWRNFIALNTRLAIKWPTIEDSKDPLNTAKKFNEIENKLNQLDESPMT